MHAFQLQIPAGAFMIWRMRATRKNQKPRSGIAATARVAIAAAHNSDANHSLEFADASGNVKSPESRNCHQDYLHDHGKYNAIKTYFEHWRVNVGQMKAAKKLAIEKCRVERRPDDCPKKRIRHNSRLLSALLARESEPEHEATRPRPARQGQVQMKTDPAVSANSRQNPGILRQGRIPVVGVHP